MQKLSNMQSEFQQFTLNLTAKIYKILYSNNFLTLIVIFIRPSDGSVIVSNINFHAFLFFVQCQIFFFQTLIFEVLPPKNATFSQYFKSIIQ